MVNGTILSSLILSNSRSINGTFINYLTISLPVREFFQSSCSYGRAFGGRPSPDLPNSPRRRRSSPQGKGAPVPIQFRPGLGEEAARISYGSMAMSIPYGVLAKSYPRTGGQRKGVTLLDLGLRLGLGLGAC